MARSALLIALGAVTIPGWATAQTTIEAQLFMGSALSAPLPVTISQTGQPDVRFTAHWDTNPLRPTFYYAARLGLWRGGRGWRMDLTHHKLYLTGSRPSEVQEFRITNGFNMVTVSRAFRRNRFTYSFGAGPVITYPINTIRGRRLDHEGGWDGYHLSGGTMVAMATREVPLWRRLFLSVDARGSASYVKVPVVDGHATVPNAALHLHLGVGYTLGGGG
jgi:hypothetical protein